MDSRRLFLKKMGILSGAAGLSAIIPPSIQQAVAINAEAGTTFYDAEHVVFLMQENRSFDHMFGTLKGVRGFNDPRVFLQPTANKTWLQSVQTDNGMAFYAPFHLDINKTNFTFHDGLAHSWKDQLSARNGGKYDKWVKAKTSGCMGYFNRDDLPFYYQLADAFTICDHNFCSSLTGTTPNRLFYFTGTNRPQTNGISNAVVENGQAESRNNKFVDWDTFPEILEDNNVSWKIYQNELWTSRIPNDTWLGNYGDNPLEYITRYNVKLSAYFRKNDTDKTAEFNQLDDRQKNLISKAFTTNIESPEDYLGLSSFPFTDDKGERRQLNIPKNDLFYQFRSDVTNGTLPAVSWLVAPEKFSDHPSAPLYGPWYVSEALDILTKNPEVWKKTIFIINYDENDGYFDHMPPYVVPTPGDFSTGRVSESIDPASDYHIKDKSPMGLGYRVPLLIVSPWSKGGYVNSQVSDHTSCLMFLENFLSKKTGREIKSPQISSWRRAICSDLTSAFRSAGAHLTNPVSPLKKENIIVGIQNAYNKPDQKENSVVSKKNIKLINNYLSSSPELQTIMPQQEKGTRPACAVPYQLYAEAGLDPSKQKVELELEAGVGNFGGKLMPAGAPFQAYSLTYNDTGKTWNYGLTKGDTIRDNLKLSDFKQKQYHLAINGPNGFFRKFSGDKNDPALKVRCLYEIASCLTSKKGTGNILLFFENTGDVALDIKIGDTVYENNTTPLVHLAAKETKTTLVDLHKSSGWYDVTIEVGGNSIFSKQYAGHVETGEDSITDPYMGGLF